MSRLVPQYRDGVADDDRVQELLARAEWEVLPIEGLNHILRHLIAHFTSFDRKHVERRYKHQGLIECQERLAEGRLGRTKEAFERCIEAHVRPSLAQWSPIDLDAANRALDQHLQLQLEFLDLISSSSTGNNAKIPQAIPSPSDRLDSPQSSRSPSSYPTNDSDELNHHLIADELTPLSSVPLSPVSDSSYEPLCEVSFLRHNIPISGGDSPCPKHHNSFENDHVHMGFPESHISSHDLGAFIVDKVMRPEDRTLWLDLGGETMTPDGHIKHITITTSPRTKTYVFDLPPPRTRRFKTLLDAPWKKFNSFPRRSYDVIEGLTLRTILEGVITKEYNIYTYIRDPVKDLRVLGSLRNIYGIQDLHYVPWWHTKISGGPGLEALGRMSPKERIAAAEDFTTRKKNLKATGEALYMEYFRDSGS